MESFKLSYIGGIGRVTGSSTLVQHHQTQFLVDCGMVQGEAHSDHANNQPFPFNPREIKFIILTHAHLDHCGLIPRLVNEGFNGKIYCTNATQKLTIEILKDAARISKLYTEKTIAELEFESIDHRDGFKWGKLVPIDTDLMLAFYRSAHILGSVSAVVADTNKIDSIWFSGDIGRNSREEMLQPLLKYRQSPDYRNKLVVCESTYGAKPSETLGGFDKRQEYYLKVFEETLLKNRGSVVIPAFSLQRTQDILTDLFLLFRKHPSLCNGISVICDSPMARKVSKIYADEMLDYQTKNGEKNYKYLNPALVDILSEDKGEAVNTLAEIFSSEKTKLGQHTFSWKKRNQEHSGPAVFISSAGMCSAGPVLNHLKRCLPNENDTVILTGYQGQGTVGSKLMSIMLGQPLEDKPLDKKLDLKPSDVQAKILMMKDYSGHADSAGLLGYLFNTERGYSPPEIHLNHGDNNAREALKESILKRHEELEAEYPGKYNRPNVCIPQPNSTYTMTEGVVEQVELDEAATGDLREILNYLASIDKRLAALETAITGTQTKANEVPVVVTGTTPEYQIENSHTEKNHEGRISKKITAPTEHAAFNATIDRDRHYTTDCKILNDICKRHPAISCAQITGENVIGLDVTYGNYGISILGEYKYQDSRANSTNSSGWAETETVGDMIKLISTIDVAHRKNMSFSFGDVSQSSTEPKYSDSYLNVKRNIDGGIRLL